MSYLTFYQTSARFPVLQRAIMLLSAVLVALSLWLFFHFLPPTQPSTPVEGLAPPFQSILADLSRWPNTANALPDPSGITPRNGVAQSASQPSADSPVGLNPYDVWLSGDRDLTSSIAWGDVDGDGDLDLAAGNRYFNKVYQNMGGSLQITATWTSGDSNPTNSVAWGDMDGDGDLDLAVGNGCLSYPPYTCYPNRLYLNVGGTLQTTASWTSDDSEPTNSVAWGDVDGDGNLDLAVGNGCLSVSPYTCYPNKVYLNVGSTLQITASWISGDSEPTNNVAWGDMDGDGDLDLGAGNGCLSHSPYTCYQDKVYLNANGALQTTAAWTSVDSDATYSVAWGDMDGDGALDLAAGNDGGPSKVYLNAGAGLQTTAAYSTTQYYHTRSVAWGDVDRDGDLDLAIGYYQAQDEVYLNVEGILQATAAWTSEGNYATSSVAWGDMDGDGDLDLAVGGLGDPKQVYMNLGGVLREANDCAWVSDDSDETEGIAWGDVDGDGDLDLAAGNWGTPSKVYLNVEGVLQATAYYSTTDSDLASGVAWGDMDGNGYLDLAIGNVNSPNRVYPNVGGVLQPTAVWTSTNSDATYGVAWGDVDGDGDLDLAAGNFSSPNEVYLNVGGVLQNTAAWASIDNDYTESVAWGDVDGDGDLDLAAGNATANKIYLNIGGVLQTTAAWTSADSNSTKSVAWGDVDGDGDLDLIAGNIYGPDKVYLNVEGVLQTTAIWNSGDSNNTMSMAWGDVDGDGDLDLAAGNWGIFGTGEPNKVYLNIGGTLQRAIEAPWTSGDSDKTASVAWGDVDGDGDLELAVGNDGQPNRLYCNTRDSRLLPGSVPFVRVARPEIDADFFSIPRIWSGLVPVTYTLSDPQGDLVKSIRAWYSPDGGGRWLPAIAAASTPTANLSTVTFVTHTQFNTTAALIPDVNTLTSTLFFTPTDMIADIDVHLNLTHTWDSDLVITLTAPFSRSVLLINRRGGSGDDFINTVLDDEAATPIVSGTAPFTGRFRPEQTLSRLDGYSPNGVWTLSVADVLGGFTGRLLSWGMTVTLNSGAVHTYFWDVAQSGFFGQSDNVVFRIQAVPAIVTGMHNATPGPYLYGSFASQTFPFRVRGTQVRVMSGTVSSAAPVANAIVYRLPKDQHTSGAPIADNTGKPFRTDSQGYLQGRGQLNVGDRLMALVPITATDTYTLYHTNATPTLTGLDAYTVTAAGVQTLTVSADNPLVLFDLDVSLQWDARNDTRFMEPFKYNLQRTSELLYDWTNGQAALGRVTVFHQRREWNFAHLRVYASNRVRPMAVKGGIASDIITEVVTTTEVTTLTYGLGQMHMGAVWNRYGEAGSELNEDWPRALAHELGHYALFLDDNYLGLNAEGHLIPVETCPGAMSDPYREDYPYDEFHPDAGWLPPCEQTLSHQIAGRSDWGTITTFYPWLSQTITNTGPNNLPLAVTQVEEYDHAPDTPSTALEDPTFYLSEGGARVQPGTGTRAFMFQDDAELGGLWAIDLGQPKLDRILARGARPGDRVCVYELAAARLGCETVSVGDQQLELTTFTLEDWQPDIAISPVNSRTIDLGVTNVPTGLALNAQLFPVMTATVGTIPLTETGSGYTGTFHLLDPVLEGYVQVWVDEPEPRRETITDFAVGGNPASMRGSGASMRGSGASMRGSGASMRGSGAPVISMDGQVILFVDETAFAPDEFYALQPVTVIPSPPEWATVVGKGYRVLATDNAPDLSTASINFTYMGEEVASGEEPWLRIYLWDGLDWEQLPTTLDLYQNSATALAQGEGLYALMSSFEIPLYGPGWNNFAYPLQEARLVTEALLSISGYYTTVYGYEAADTGDPWKVYDVTVPEWVNDLHTLEYGHGYWINASQPITWRVSSASAQSLAADSDLPNPPATYYGQVLPGSDFTPSAGMAVSTWVSDTLCGQSQTVDVNGQVVYAVNVFAVGVGNTAGCGVPGSIVTFRVDMQVMATTVAWDNSRVREVTLSSEARPVGRVYLPLIIKK